MWISVISRNDFTDDLLERNRVCSQHFVSGEAAKDWDWSNVDLIPIFHLGHSKQHVKEPEEAAARAANRCKRQAEITEKEVEEKVKRVDDTGKQLMRYSTRPSLRLRLWMLMIRGCNKWMIQGKQLMRYSTRPSLWMLITKIQRPGKNYADVMTRKQWMLKLICQNRG